MLSGQHELPSVFRTSHASLPPSAPTKLTLKLLSGGEDNAVRILNLPANVGRAVDLRSRPTARNGLFNSPFLSRHHAVIRHERGRVVVEDLGSINGTFVNGVGLKSGEPWPLADGDLLQFGSEDDDAKNSTIVAQVFFEEAPMPQKLSFAALMDPQPDDPFVADAHHHHHHHHQQQQSAPQPQPPLPIIAPAEAVGQKIAAISRSLASLGVSLRTAVPAPTRQSQEGILQILDSIESLIQQLSREEGPIAYAVEETPTVHQRPTLSAAVNIINVYEALFCSLAFLLALWIYF